MKVLHFQCETKSIERLPDGKTVRIKGYASTPHLDRHDDVVLPQAFIKTLNDYKARGGAPALLRGHNPDYPCGSIIMDGADAPVISDAGLLITADITDVSTAEQAQAGEVLCMSIGYIPLQSDYQMRPTGRIEADTGQELYTEARILKELDLVEVSIVSTPANPNALFTVQKSLTKYFNSIPSPHMKIKCDSCTKDCATGRVGTRFFCKECINKLQFKSDEVTPVETPSAPAAPVVPEATPAAPSAEVPATPEVPEPTPTPSPESAGETPAPSPAPEKGAGKGEPKEEGKVIISKEDKEKITKASKMFAELDAATAVEAPVTPEVKSTTEEVVEVKQFGDMLEKVASVLKKMSDRVTALETAEKSRPIYKGKSIMAFQGATPAHKTTEQKKETAKKMNDDGFVSMLKSSKQGTVVIGDDTEDNEE